MAVQYKLNPEFMEVIYAEFKESDGLFIDEIEIKAKLKNNIIYKIFFLCLWMLRISGLGGCIGVESASIWLIFVIVVFAHGFNNGYLMGSTIKPSLSS
ncbi:MAG: hypothetical protein EB094_03735 [Synechococcaceae bacterium WBA_3_309]|nr:hypothetical protein [Synechococcaceae bacterium WBA_3_309]